MDELYSRITFLEYRNKALQREVDEFKSGARYTKLQADYKRLIAGYIRELKSLRRESEKENINHRKVRDMWITQCDQDWETYQAEIQRALEYIQKLRDRNQELEQKYKQELEEKDAVISELTNKLKHAEALLGHDGTNTGMSTSQTPPGKNKQIPNTRPPSDKPKGGQPGHERHEFDGIPDKEPDETISHAIEAGDLCPKCGSESLVYTGEYEEKFEYDVRITVTKRRHVFWLYQCMECGEYVREGIDPRLRAKNQYGANIQALALSLMNTANASMNKAAMLLSGISGGELHPCEGYIAKLQGRAAKALEQFRKDLRVLLITRTLIYWDDTVIFILTHRACLRFYGDETIAYYTAHLHKDLAGLKEDNILPVLTEKTAVMHDHNTVNYNDEFHFTNLECNQHLERDLQRNTDDTQHTWSTDLKEHIAKTIKERNEAAAAGEKAFDEDYLAAFHQKVDENLLLGEQQYNADAEKAEKYGALFERALLRRIPLFRTEYFAWLEDFSLPTTDNLSERALRIAKTKMKVSGQFESERAAQNYATIRTYVETCRRNGINEMDALRRLCEGNPYTVSEIFQTK